MYNAFLEYFEAVLSLLRCYGEEEQIRAAQMLEDASPLVGGRRDDFNAAVAAAYGSLKGEYQGTAGAIAKMSKYYPA